MSLKQSALPAESVWDYPRPPRLERCVVRVKVEFGGIAVADSEQAMRLLETSHPPTYYIPRADVQTQYLIPNKRRSFCEFKGQAEYWDLAVDSRREAAVGWSYAAPSRGYEAIKDYVAFYSNKVDACFVGGERVIPQPGDFYGGWITSNLKGPFKGGPGTHGW